MQKLESWVRFAVLRLGIYSLAAYLAVSGFLYLQQGHILFPAPKSWHKADPARYGIAFQDLQIPVTPTEHLHAWWIPAARCSEKVILIFHGNGYVLEEMVEELLDLHAAGANLLAVDYRGYGSSTRLYPSETTVVEDARAALTHALRQRGFALNHVFVLGRSIGSGPAIQLAYENRGLGGLILESPFTSIDDAALNHLLFRLFPVSLILRSHFDNLSKIASVRVPLLVAAGTADTLTPPWMAQRIVARAAPPKQLFLVRGAGHDDLLTIGGKELTQLLQSFIERN